VRSLQWTEEDSVYVPELDEQHQAMYRLAQDLRHAVVEGEATASLELRLQRMADECHNHFRHEEGLMRDASYPQVEWHKRQHATARAQLEALAASIQAGEQAAIFESLQAIAKWMRDHTSIADRMAGAYLRNYLRAFTR
jgi:hemerythrin-like metal-binding protein